MTTTATDVEWIVDQVGRRSLRDLLDEQVAAHPDQTFLTFEATDGAQTEFSYTQFAAAVDTFAGGLLDLGVGFGDRIAVHLPNGPEIVTTLFAAATIGAVLVPSNTANTGSELGYVLSFSGAIAVVTTAAALGTIAEAYGQAPDVRTVIVARGDASVASSGDGAPSPDVRFRTVPFEQVAGALPAGLRRPVDTDLLQLLFTSGTTARPKGVMLTHANALHSGVRESTGQALDATDKLLTALPLFHVNAQSLTLLSALTVGGTAVILESFSAGRFWGRVREHGATQVSLVAMQVRTLLAQPPSAQDAEHKVRRTFFAINVTDEERERFESRFAVRFINGYGLSETMTLVLHSPAFGPVRWPSLGRPALTRRVRLVDDAGRDVPPGEVGELLVHGVPGRTLMLGYYQDPEATAATVRDGWLSTGDYMTADEQGYLYWFDRKKDVIKRAGENVSAGEVEAVIGTHPAVAEVAVIGVVDPIRDEAVLAIVVPRAGMQVTPDDVIAHCREHLASFKVPTLVQLWPELPRTSVGKLAKGEIRQRVAEQ